MFNIKKDYGLDILRISTGIVMFTAGLNKAINVLNGQPFAGTPEMFGFFKPLIDAGLPWVELLIGIGLILGLSTRAMAIANTILMIGITFSMGYERGIQPSLHTYLIFTSASIALLAAPTCLSIDGLLAKKKADNVQKIKI